MHIISLPIPPEETNRLASLHDYQILDTLNDEDLDNLTALVASIFQVPIALITIMDEKRQWFKSNFGLSLKETERSISFCQYTIMDYEVFEVENTATDQRFANNPFVVQEPYIRYYCGAPLINESGYIMGSLSIIDKVERKLDQAQKKTLQMFAKQVVNSFEFKRKSKQLETEKAYLEDRIAERTQQLEQQLSLLHESKQQVIQSEALFSTVFRLNPFPTAITRMSDGRILHANEQALKVFGFNHEQITIVTTLQLNIWANLLEREELIDRLQKQHTVRGYETTFRNSKGELWSAVNSLEVIEVNGEACLLWIMQDITERKKTAEAMKAYAGQLELLNANKDKFFSIIAHDLLSPLNGLLGSSDLLAEHIEMLSQEDIQKLAQGIYFSSTNLKRLLSNLLEWASMQTGTMAFQPKRVNLGQIVKNVVELLKDNAQKKQVTIHLNLQEDIHLEADVHMLESILRNLLANAIKFTNPEGKITISAQWEATQVLVNVKDTGVGMSKDLQERLFRIDTKHTTLGTAGEKGTGLGMLICKEFVERHRGKMWVESEIGIGTSISFTLPG